MKPFDLQAALNGAPVITRDGRRVDHISHAPNLPANSRVIYAIVTEHNVEVYRAYEDGRYIHTETHPNDLLMAPGKQSRWDNLYRLLASYNSTSSRTPPSSPPAPVSKPKTHPATTSPPSPFSERNDMTTIDTLKQSLEDVLQRIIEMQQLLDELRETDDGPEPAIHQIDWSKMPKGILVEVRDYSNAGWFRAIFKGVTPDGLYTDHLGSTWNYIRLIEQPEVVFWKGGDCPVPEGVVVELHYRDGTIEKSSAPQVRGWNHFMQCDDDIIGYRILGVAEGWTS